MSACPAYAPPSGSSVALTLAHGYVPPGGNELVFLLDPCEGSTPSGAGPRNRAYGLVYGIGEVRSARPMDAPWTPTVARQRQSGSAWGIGAALQRHVVSHVARTGVVDVGRGVDYGSAVASGALTLAPWTFVGAADRHAGGAWSRAVPSQVLTRVAWVRVYPHDAANDSRWLAAKPPAIIFDPPPVTSGYVPPAGDAVHLTAHGSYTTPAGGAVGFLLDSDKGDLPPYIVLRQDPVSGYIAWGKSIVVDGGKVIRWGRGVQYHRPDPPPIDGPWTGSPNEPPPIPIARKVYIVMNDVSVVRLPERTPIDVLSVDLNASVDAWCWSVRMELGNPAQVALLTPDGNGPKMVEITMNSYVWTAIIEGRERSREHANAATTVTGRSQTALLAETYTARRSLAVSDGLSAQQLAALEISDRALPFTIDWQGLDWVVPGGVWYYQDLAPIDVISQIAAARGAVLQSHPSDPTLIVQSRYPVSPWGWSAGLADVALPSSWITGINAQQQSKPMYDAVIIAGQQQGVLAKITRDASAGETFAQQVVDQLMVTPGVATERGRNVLSDRGIQEQVDMDIPLFAPGTITAGMSGLYSPLLLVDVQDPDDPWQGQTVGVSISARRGGPDNKALEIWQKVSLERHLSDAN